MRKISGRANHNDVLVIFENIALKLKENCPIFSSFNPFPSLPSVATDGKQFQRRKIVLNNKARSLFLEYN